MRASANILCIITLGLVLAPAACTRDNACSERLAVMRTAFEAIPPGASSQPSGPVEASYLLPISERGEALPGDAVVLRISGDGVLSFDGAARVQDGEAAVAEAAERLARAGKDRAVYLAIAPTAWLEPHRVMLAKLGEQAPLRVLVRAPDVGGRPPPTASPAIAARLAALADADLSTKAIGLAEAMRAAAGKCDAIHQAFQELGSVAPERRQATLLNAVLTGAESCGCEVVDVEGLSAVVWATVMGDGPPPRWLPLQPAKSGAKLAPDAKGAELVRQLETGPAVALVE